MMLSVMSLCFLLPLCYCNEVAICKTNSSSVTNDLVGDSRIGITCEKGEKGANGDVGMKGNLSEIDILNETLTGQLNALNLSMDEAIKFNSRLDERFSPNKRNEFNITIQDAEMRLIKFQENFTRKLEELQDPYRQFENCDEVYQHDGFAWDGFYTMFVQNITFQAYCEFQKGGYNWMTFQKRTNGEVDFFRGWSSYVKGFGKKDGEYWLGLEVLHQLTNIRPHRLRVDLEDWENNTAYAEYSTIVVGNSSTNYQLQLGNFSGNAGDALDYHNHKPFSTYDRDNDGHGCSSSRHSGWWFNSCTSTNLNGKYRDVPLVDGDYTGLHWYQWVKHNSYHYSVKRAEMKIRPN